MTINKYIVGAIVILVSIALGFVLCMWLKKPTTITNTVTEYIKGDTVRVIEKHFFKVTEYVKAEVKNDTAKTIFRLEKVFDKDTIKSVTNIKYSISDSTFNIEQSFDYVKTKEFAVDTIKIKVPVEKIVYKDVPIWEKPLVMYVSGVITAILIFFLSGN